MVRSFTQMVLFQLKCVRCFFKTVFFLYKWSVTRQDFGCFKRQLIWDEIRAWIYVDLVAFLPGEGRSQHQRHGFATAQVR